jgi:hypothetical protein
MISGAFGGIIGLKGASMLLEVTNGDRIRPAALALGLAGSVPYWVAAVIVLTDFGPLAASLVVWGIIAYGAVGLAFLGGIRWGLALRPVGARRQAWELALSTAAPLAGFAALMAPPVVGVSVLIAGMLAQALWDQMCADTGRLPVWFARLRMVLTSLAVVPLLAVLGRLVLTSA